jgi:RsiW-degrading membrane proteinase PrsW (M82 family)
MTCPHCGRDTEAAEFCTLCGASLHEDAAPSRARRLDSFAAHPHQRVALPAVFTTLFPHAAHRQLHELRAGGLIGLAVIVLVAAVGFPGAALAGAAILVPALFLLYLREVEVYHREPLGVLARSLGWGALAGAAITFGANLLAGSAVEDTVDTGQVLVLAALVPLLASLVTPLLVLGLRRRHGQTIDGITFGVAAGLGYALAETAINFAPVIGDAASRVDTQSWVLTVVSAGALVPLVHGTVAGAMAGAWWRLRSGSRRDLPGLVLVAAPLAAMSFAGGSAVLAGLGAPAWVVLVWQVVIVGLMLVGLRVLLHDALLDEAHSMGLREQVCPHCHEPVEAAGFCPRCGLALAAAPRSAVAPPAATTEVPG